MAMSNSPSAAAHLGRRPQLTNQTLLRRLGDSRASAARLHWRNALVSQNLGLVHLVANRESQRTGRPFDDLCSAGYEGLIRAVECFDTSREIALSSFAVPYIQGAMRMDQRDRQQPIRTPRRLRELLQQARRLQAQRQAAGLQSLAATELAAALGCSLERLEEAGAVQRALAVASLDQPVGGDGDPPSCLLERTSTTAASGAESDGQLHWLRHQLAQLPAADRELVEGRWIDGLSWSALGERLGCEGRLAQRRGETLLRQLQAAGSQPQASRASTAARAV
ncbi:MAG: sigma-70 family RNA polymerase sigma factor [Cyanobacteriota bacterium]